MQYPDVEKTYYPEFGEFHNVYGTKGFVDVHDKCVGSPVEFTCDEKDTAINGTGASPPMCDLIHYVDAIRKLQAAADEYKRSGQPFALFVGIRHPHVAWRLAQHYIDLYHEADVPLPAHNTLDKSIDPIAYTTYTPMYNLDPYVGMAKDWVRFLRRR